MNPPEVRELEGRLRSGGDARGPRPSVLAAARRAAEQAGAVDVSWGEIDTPVGHLVLAASSVGVVTISYEPAEIVLPRLAERVSPRVLQADRRLDPLRRQLEEYFGGRRTRFDVAIDWVLTRGFRREALGQLARVPFGETVSYAELAQRAGSPRAHRAVGTAMATNPIPIVVPCHRVLRSGGGLGGYGGGLDVKRWLLAHEGCVVPGS